jgi:hypothetical protein
MAAQSIPYDYMFKLLMIGDAGVGKVSPQLFRISWHQSAWCIFVLTMDDVDSLVVVPR